MSKNKTVELPDNIEKIGAVDEGDTLVCRLTKPVVGAQYANLMTRLNRSHKLTGVKILVLPVELDVEGVERQQDTEDEGQTDTEQQEDTEDLNEAEELNDEVFPKHTGGGWYQLSNGEKVKGKKEAVEAQQQLSST